MKKCPYCAEEIQDEAIKCKHCGEMLDQKKDTPKRMAIVCPKCLKEYDSSWKVCFNCAVPLIKKEVEFEMKEGDAAIGDVNQINPQVTCPRCGSKSITTIKKGYDAEGGCCGAILLGPLGLLCGAAEANKLSNVCQSCGYAWEIKG